MELKSLCAEDFIEGQVFLFDKPLGWTSFDVVNRLKTILKYRCGLKKIKIGHAGTLDPLATGLLIICFGKQTKSIEKFQAFEKEYSGEFFLGATTPSFDLETEVDKKFPTDHISPEMVQKAANSFLRESDQMPPAFSAKKIAGQRAYDMARRGEDPKVKTRQIFIYKFDVVNLELPLLYFNIVCSKGTYIRAIARDLGEKVHSGAYLKSLRRERIGEFHVKDAMSLEYFEKQILQNTNFSSL